MQNAAESESDVEATTRFEQAAAGGTIGRVRGVRSLDDGLIDNRSTGPPDGYRFAISLAEEAASYDPL